MRVVEINAVHVGSTGKIMFGIADVARTAGHEAFTFSPHYYQRYENTAFPKKLHHTYFGNPMSNWMHLRCAQLTGFHGCFSLRGTLHLIRCLNAIKPDIVHLHNLHGYNVNLPLLVTHLKKDGVKVIWTLHDCWTFTGQCPHYTMIGCNKWQTHCHDCPQCNDYPKTFVDRSDKMYDLKRMWFTGMDAVLVTPSQWLADQVAQSFLKDYPVRVINNGIDLEIFRPTESNFKQKYHCEGKKIVLGVAMGWGVRKGLDVFVDLASRLPEDYQIVLVGGNEQTDRQLPSNVISIHRTQNQRELAEIYSAADVFANPTREDNFPTVNIESLACGTPVITFDTGGSPEILDETCGMVVPCDDVEAMEWEIRRVCEEKPFTREACVQRAKKFDMWKKFGEYVELYREIADKQ